MTSTSSESGAYESVFVARQPVFDRAMQVWGYELLFRHSGAAKTAVITDQNQATLQVISDGIAIAQPTMPPDKMLLINFPKDLLLDGAAYALPKKRCIVEILETVEPTPEILAALRELKAAGYYLALDDYVGQEGVEELVALADLLKVDVLNMKKPMLERLTRLLKRYPCKLLAEKVEDRDVFELCRDLGYDYFQGYFFSKPETVEGRKTSSNQVSKLRLISQMSVMGSFNINEIAEILQTDASLSLRIFRYVNSAMFGLEAEVKSIQHALLLLGERQTRECLRVMLLTDMAGNSQTEEILYLSAQRGRFLELIASTTYKAPIDPQSMFLLGLFSLLDTLMGQPIAALVDKLPLDDRLKQALCNHQGPLAIWLDLLLAYERGEWTKVEGLTRTLQLDETKLAPLQVQSMEWTRDVLRAKI
jgi:c-di-GMP phosphodiesterase